MKVQSEFLERAQREPVRAMRHEHLLEAHALPGLRILSPAAALRLPAFGAAR